ncbi:MAG TPA: thymidine phosphorylase family protein [Dyella sp.]|uniref:thymidine phosphorylase family protein n=1 Tax=Dyella sp. TaxID=1869338 RepID=UPI002F938B80
MDSQSTADEPMQQDIRLDVSRPLLPFDRLRRMGIDSGDEHVIYLHEDSSICRSEGFGAYSRVQICMGERRILARLNMVRGALLKPDEAGLSESAWRALAPRAGETAMFSHPATVESLSLVRAKIHGQVLRREDFEVIVRDIADRRYSMLELAAFVTACADNHLALEEVGALTGAMVSSGARVRWPHAMVVDKHCIGGLAGNRTTPILVAIVTSLGLIMPKTSSRAITSPAGTADTMEMLAPVDLSLQHMRETVERTGGCVAWGGSIGLSPVDDMMISIERALDIDGEGQLVASVLSKKIAAGSTHVLIDVPVGPTAKVRDHAEARSLADCLTRVAGDFGVHVRCLFTDGSQPVGRGVGPGLEAHDVLAVLQGLSSAPMDLRERAISLAAALLELSGAAGQGARAVAMATQALNSGAAWRQFQAICEAQGGMRVPGWAAHQYPFRSTHAGCVLSIDNRRLSRVAKLAGAPKSPLAGLMLHVRLGDRVDMDQPIFTVHAQTRGELAYAMEYVHRHPCIVTLADAP